MTTSTATTQAQPKRVRRSPIPRGERRGNRRQQILKAAHLSADAHR
jgi:hypothetical protein